MASKILALMFGLLAAVLATSLASAGVLDINALSYPSTALHNSDITVTFNVTYSGSLSSSTVNFSSSTTNIGSWVTLPGLSVVENDSVAHQFTAVLRVPAQATGTISASLIANGNASAQDTEAISVTINNTPSLSVTSLTALSRTSNATIRVNNTGNTALSNINLSASGDINVSFSSNNFALSAGGTRDVNVNSLNGLSDLALGSHTAVILAKDVSTGTNNSLTYTVPGQFCDSGNVNTSKLEILDISDESGLDDEWSWKPLDNIEIEVEVENKLGDDEDFVVEIGLYDTEENKFVELNGEDEDDDTLTKDIALDDDDSDTLTFNFQLPADVEDSSGRYVLYAKFYVDGHEKNYCISNPATTISSSAENIEINKKSREVIIDEVSSPKIVSAGDTVTVTAKAFNIGTEDEKKVKMTLTNSKLGLDLESSPSSIDSGESDEVEFSFIVPYNAVNGDYNLKLVAYYDYDKGDDDYDKDSESYDFSIKVAGGVINSTSTSSSARAGSAAISASLESDSVVAGKAMEVTVKITNLESNTTTFIVSVEGYDSWAELGSISDRIITLSPGQSKDITLNFNVDKDATGEQTFVIKTTAGSKVDAREVAVEISSNSLLSKLSNSLSDNKMLWIIGLVNLVLIILIIVLVVRIFR